MSINKLSYFLKIEIVNSESNVNYELGDETFRELVMVESSTQIGVPSLGLVIPTCELICDIPNPMLAENLIKKGVTKITISIGSDERDLTIFNFVCSNFVVSLGGIPNRVIFYGIQDLEDFISKISQNLYKEKTSIEVFEEGCSLKLEKLVKKSANDKMNWIRAGVTEWEFLSSVLKSSYLGDDDFLLGCLTFDKNGESVMRLASYKEQIDKSEYDYYISIDGSAVADREVTKLLADTIDVETEIGLSNYLGSETTDLNIVRLPNQKYEKSSGGSVSEMGVFTSKRAFPAMLDMGNTHEKWWEAKLHNEIEMSSLYRNIVYAELSGQFQTKMKPLDIVYVIGQSMGSSGGLLTGNYLLMERASYFSLEKTAQRLTLCKKVLEG